MQIIDALLAKIIEVKYRKVASMLADPIGCQERLFHEFIRVGRKTLFGKDHGFDGIQNYEQFKNRVPLRSYEELLPYIEKVKAGEKNILWKGRPRFLGKTSGTTSQTKYIPVTADSLKNQISAPQYAALNYAHRYGNYDFLKGKVFLFSDGHFFEKINGIKAAPISTIANSCVPRLYRFLRLPSDEINAIPVYEKRIEAMIETSLGNDIRTLVAMPVWLLVYLRKLKASTGKTFSELFPRFRLLMLSGMDYEPFLPEIRQYIDFQADILETYPSTEAFIAYQDRVDERGMQLVLNNGIFFEFVPVNELHRKDANRISLKKVEVGINYALVLNTNAGLWGYLMGDTLRFVSVYPHRVVITGRIAQYISAFGEHVTVEETDKSLAETARECGATIVEYTVAPNIRADGSRPYHEWFIEFGTMPADMDDFAKRLDQKICERNFSYKDVVVHLAIAPLKIQVVPVGGFELMLQASGRTGLQQKVPHLRNDYHFAQQLKDHLTLQ